MWDKKDKFKKKPSVTVSVPMLPIKNTGENQN